MRNGQSHLGKKRPAFAPKHHAVVIKILWAIENLAQWGPTAWESLADPINLTVDPHRDRDDVKDGWTAVFCRGVWFRGVAQIPLTPNQRIRVERGYLVLHPSEPLQWRRSKKDIIPDSRDLHRRASSDIKYSNGLNWSKIAKELHVEDLFPHRVFACPDHTDRISDSDAAAENGYWNTVPRIALPARGLQGCLWRLQSLKSHLSGASAKKQKHDFSNADKHPA